MKKAYRTLTASAINLLCIYAVGQVNLCEGDTSIKSFWPVQKGITRNYYTLAGPFATRFNGDSTMIHENIYYKVTEEYHSGKRRDFYIRESDGNIYIYDSEKNVESLELSNIITPGYTWENPDKSWKYTVIDTTSSFSSPECTFTGLLNIKAEPKGETKEGDFFYYNLYYKRGVGLVAMFIEGQLFSFLTTDAAKIVGRNYTISGCELLASDEQRSECTSTKVQVFVGNNFNYGGKIKKGKLVLKFLVNETGNVENVSVTQPIKNAEGQTEEAIRLVKLIKFMPRLLNGVPLKTWAILPIKF